MSLFSRLGGYAFLDVAVPRFYDKCLADPEVGPFFARTDMRRQLIKQRRFLAHVFGGPHPWDGQGLRHVHRKMEIQPRHFDLVIEHLRATLAELEVATELIDEAIAIAMSHRDDVVAKPE